MSTVVTEVRPWRPFAVSVRAMRRLSPSFLRVTLTGDQLDRFADNGYDLRLKLILPAVEGGLAMLPTGADWYTRLRALPPQRQCPVRTYTTRAVRHAECEVDVDIVVHPEQGHGLGPVALWAQEMRVGDEIVLLGPNRDFDGEHGGIDFRPPAAARRLLIAADETAVPAACAIVERLDGAAAAEVLLEVPHTVDAEAIRADLPAPVAGVRVRLLPRDGAGHGSLLEPAVREAAAGLLPESDVDAEIEDVDVDATLLWEVPDAAAASHGLYAWLAGEAGVIKSLRRHLVGERGIDRRSVAFMGYWRQGRPEGG